MSLLVDEKTGRKLCSTEKAAAEYGCKPGHIRTLASKGILWQRVESPRVVLYDLDEVRRVAKENRAKRRKRGGRPPSGGRAA